MLFYKIYLFLLINNDLDLKIVNNLKILMKRAHLLAFKMKLIGH